MAAQDTITQENKKEEILNSKFSLTIYLICNYVFFNTFLFLIFF